MRERLKTILSGKRTEGILPWVVLALALPSLVAWNGLFLKLFPKNNETVNFENAVRQSFSPDANLFQAAFVYNSRNPDRLFGNFYYTLGTQLASQGQLIPAEAMLSKAIRLLPENPYPHLNYAIVLEALQRTDEAIKQYQEVVRLDKKSVQAFYNLGLLYDKQGQSDLAIKTMHEAVNLAPENPLINYDLGVLYAKCNNYEQSALYSGKATQGAGQNFAEAFNNYGYALAQLGRYQEALQAIERSLALKPDSAPALDSKGFALHGLGRYQEALQAYQQALKQDPSIGEIYEHIGYTYEKLQAYDKAIKAFETYLQLTPDAPNRAQVEERLRQLRKWAANKPGNMS
ncbi:MAG TPA: tetratricopeptide repeat protein [Oculatellaceae cyanobacterium]|jgi:tetratricopeptide (TPR) repeat protein